MPDAEFIGHPSQPTQAEVNLVNDAVATVGHCNVNSDCPFATTDPQEAQRWIIEELHRRGVCAGQHRNGETDEGAVATSGCTGLWSGYHWVKWPTNPGDPAKAVWARVPTAPCMGSSCTSFDGGSYRGAWTIPSHYCGVQTNCILPWGPGRWVEVAIENIGNPPTSQLASAATKWCTDVGDIPRDPGTGNLAPPGWPYACGTKCCRIGAHEGELGIACESSLYGNPTWSVEQGSVRLVEQENPFNIKVAEGSGRLRNCGSTAGADGNLPCTSVQVVAQPGPVVGP